MERGRKVEREKMSEGGVEILNICRERVSERVSDGRR